MIELRLRWAGAILLMLMVVAGGFLTVRYFGVKAGWWSTLLPSNGAFAAIHSAYDSLHALIARVELWFTS